MTRSKFDFRGIAWKYHKSSPSRASSCFIFGRPDSSWQGPRDSTICIARSQDVAQLLTQWVASDSPPEGL